MKNINIAEAQQLIKAIVDMQLQKNAPTLNLLLLGSSGIGKSALVLEQINKMFGGCNNLFNYNEKKVAVIEYHGGSMDTDNIILPSIVKVELPDEQLKYIYKKDKPKEIAFSQVPNAMTHVPERFFAEKVLLGKADLVVVIIQDVNKNQNPNFNNFLKSLLESRLGSLRLPKVCLIMTANPSEGDGFINQQFDKTVLSTCVMAILSPTDEEYIKWGGQHNEDVREYLRENIVQEKIEVEIELSSNMRAWNKLGFALKNSPEELHSILIFGILKEEDAVAFNKYIKEFRSSESIVSSYLKNPEEAIVRIAKLEKLPHWNNFFDRIKLKPALDILAKLVDLLKTDSDKISFVTALIANELGDELKNKYPNMHIKLCAVKHNIQNK